MTSNEKDIHNPEVKKPLDDNARKFLVTPISPDFLILSSVFSPVAAAAGWLPSVPAALLSLALLQPARPNAIIATVAKAIGFLEIKIIL